MKIKTSELTGPALDWAVDKAEGHIRPDGGYYCGQHGVSRRYSTDWAQGGPIIEREWLQVTPWPNEHEENMRWHCVQHDAPVQCHAYGPTPLVAAMRCLVASRLGDKVDVPDELTE